MGLFAKDLNTMDDLFVHALRDIYYAENRFVEALPDMLKRTSSPQLKQAFRSHLGETETQVLRLQEVFRMYGAEVKGSIARLSMASSRRPTMWRTRSKIGRCWTPL